VTIQLVEMMGCKYTIGHLLHDCALHFVGTPNHTAKKKKKNTINFPPNLKKKKKKKDG